MNNAQSVLPSESELDSESIPPELSIGYQIRRLHQSMTLTMERFTQSRDISNAQWGYLRHLYFEDGLSQRELSDRVGRQGATTLSALKRLEQAGLVEVRKNQSDQRKNRIYLTSVGRELVTELMPFVRRVEEIAFRDFSEEEIKQFWNAVTRMRVNFEDSQNHRRSFV